MDILEPEIIGKPPSVKGGSSIVVTYFNEQGLERKLQLAIGDVLGKGGFSTVQRSLFEGWGEVAAKVQSLQKVGVFTILNEIRLSSSLEGYESQFNLVKKVIFSSQNRMSIAKFLPKVKKEPVGNKFSVSYWMGETKDVVYTSSDPIAKFVAISDDLPKDIVIMIYDLISGVNLTTMRKTFGTPPPLDFLNYTKQLIDCLRILSEKGILHKDIKPDNIMVQDGKLKFIDFGLSCMFVDCNLPGGTPNYLAPEVLLMAKIHENEVLKGDFDTIKKIDIFSAGCVLFFLLLDKGCWQTTGFPRITSNIQDRHMSVNDEKELLRFKGTEYDFFIPLIKGMIRPHLGERFTIEQCLQYINGV